MSTPPQRPEDWTPEQLDRLRDALKAEPVIKNQAGSNPSKGDDR